MTNRLEQAINGNDGDRATKILWTRWVSCRTTS